MWSVDAALTQGPFSFSGEVVGFDKGTNGSFGDFWNGLSGVEGPGGSSLGSEVSDDTPWGITGSYMVTPDEYEIAVRYDDSDNNDNEDAITAGVNRYMSGHDIKWYAGYTWYESDGPIGDVDVLTVGIGMSF
jgi:hypothetical protein